MNIKQKGTIAERELIHMFWSTNDWAAFRSAGSGSMKYPGPDIIAGNRVRKLALEIKSTSSDKKYLTQEDIMQLQEFCNRFGAEPWFGVRFSNKKWFFLNIEDIDKTAKQFVISKELAERKGLTFEELIGNFG